MRRRRKLGIALLAVPIIVIGGDVLYWRLAERHLELGFAAWLADRRAAGWTAALGEPVHGGWPLAATLTIPQFALRGGETDIPRGLNWSAEKLVLRISLWRPGRLEVAAEGAQRLRFGDAPEIPYTADHLRFAEALQSAGSGYAAQLTAINFRAGVPATAESGLPLTIAQLQLRWEVRPTAQSGEPAVSFALDASAIGPPAGISRALGPRIANLSIDGALDGPVPRTPALVQRAEAWRDGGGTLEIKRLAVAWGPLDLTASATLALDDQLQPMGTGNARVIGYAETLDALALHGVVSRSAATAAKAVLSLLAQTPDDGGPSDVEVPLTLQYRTLSMRQVPLVRLPELDWP